MAIQRVMLTDSRKEDVFYEEAIKTLRTNMQFSGVIVVQLSRQKSKLFIMN